ncbi:hypothetical protein P2H44_18435 [Albimonas sp. CAU 1670]|uniref:hypothetical protein n=1 Tax=Albimonas sp. CAU 1670 TaxID=3032599 RepID=UPI0023DC5F65|nr:hypothetical protein [Albimonas sp. CAU 1670]MDF2234543.1 hypothetical protein [Albimonas sp. CAU 1670]
MTISSAERESIRIAHLTMIQGVIARMGSNSFTLKALSATFGSASVAIMASADNPSSIYAVAAIVPMAIFWFMDAKYLRLEKAYRTLYDRVRKSDEIEAYSLDAREILKDTPSAIRLALSWSVCWFYIAILLALGAVSVIILTSAEGDGACVVGERTANVSLLRL